MRPRVYYHLFQAEGDVAGGWRFLWHDAMLKLMASGLSEAADCQLVLVGSDHQRRFVTQPTTEEKPWLWRYPWLNLRAEYSLEENEGWWEMRTIRTLWQDAIAHHNTSTEAYPILYIHSKGALTENHCTHLWREYMQAFLIEDYRNCMDTLMWHGYDTCGVDLNPFGGLHYSGNFWWARSDYIAALPDPQASRDRWAGEPRMWSEYWLCHLPGKHKGLWHSGHDDLYRNPIFRSAYVHALKRPLP